MKSFVQVFCVSSEMNEMTMKRTNKVKKKHENNQKIE